MFACNGILFNHESPRRGETFVTRKVRHKQDCCQVPLPAGPQRCHHSRHSLFRQHGCIVVSAVIQTPQLL
jgi:hypothetical protein